MKIIIEIGDDPKREPEEILAAVKTVTEDFLLEPAYELEIDDDESEDDTIDNAVTVNVVIEKQDMGRITVESKSNNPLDVEEAVAEYLIKGSINEVEPGEWVIYDWFES
jgi:hypothetical protein